VDSPQLGDQRDLVAYLPPSYEGGDRRYPVLYLQDGQNLFDEATSHAGEWRVDETMQTLAGEGIEAIVVGVPNGGTRRADEYRPDRRGDRYLAFLTDSVKPIVDTSLRTLPGRGDTGLGGSSLGAVISLYGLFSRPDVFGFAALMSPAFLLLGEGIVEFVAAAPLVPARVYLDTGSREHDDPSLAAAYAASVERMHAVLRAKGYGTGDLRYRIDPEGHHHESAWARRLPDALRFLLPS
jgi:predicted alpha/beta superfamily hydrolase